MIRPAFDCSGSILSAIFCIACGGTFCLFEISFVHMFFNFCCMFGHVAWHNTLSFVLLEFMESTRSQTVHGWRVMLFWAVFACTVKGSPGAHGTRSALGFMFGAAHDWGACARCHFNSEVFMQFMACDMALCCVSGSIIIGCAIGPGCSSDNCSAIRLWNLARLAS